jgi:hypothetical protein
LVLALVLAGGGTSRAQTADPAGMYEFGGGKLDGLGVSEANDAGLYLDDAIARRRVRLGAYSIEKADRNARLLPGLAGVAKQVQGAQKAHMPLEGSSKVSSAIPWPMPWSMRCGASRSSTRFTAIRTAVFPRIFSNSGRLAAPAPAAFVGLPTRRTKIGLAQAIPNGLDLL